MKSLIFTFLTLFSLSLSGQVFWTDNFEGAGPTSGDREAVGHANDDNGTGAGICGPGNYFFRTTNPGSAGDPNGLNAVFANYEGSTYWRGEDLDACVANPDVINFTGIDITGRSALHFRGLFGARSVTSFETLDEIRVEYSIDASPFVTGAVFEPNGSNTRLARDTDNNGVGDPGLDLLEALVEHTFFIAGTGSVLALRITCNVDGGGEEFAFDNFRVEDNFTLPVELTSFTVKKSKSQSNLSWITDSELNNDHFLVEHSLDGLKFETIGKVDGAGNSLETLSYAFVHGSPQHGANYYRLKQVDFDGKFSYSNIEVVNFESDNGTSFAISPNPFKNTLTIRMEDLESETSYKVFDLMGKVVLQGQFTDKQLTQTLDLSMLNSGVFVVTVGEGKHAVSQRIVKL